MPRHWNTHAIAHAITHTITHATPLEYTCHYTCHAFGIHMPLHMPCLGNTHATPRQGVQHHHQVEARAKLACREVCLHWCVQASWSAAVTHPSPRHPRTCRLACLALQQCASIIAPASSRCESRARAPHNPDFSTALSTALMHSVTHSVVS